jgi:hypothetical protein
VSDGGGSAPYLGGDLVNGGAGQDFPAKGIILFRGPKSDAGLHRFIAFSPRPGDSQGWSAPWFTSASKPHGQTADHLKIQLHSRKSRRTRQSNALKNHLHHLSRSSASVLSMDCLSTRRRLSKMTRRLAIADTVRFNFRAIEALSIFESSNARSCASSAGVHGWPAGRGPSLISLSPSARARPGGDSGEAVRATGGDGGAVSWHGSARAISLLFPLRLQPNSIEGGCRF